MEYRKDIDGLRAISILAVICNHFNKNLLPGGYLGVDIFFVISGFVITTSLLNKDSKSAFEFLGAFYEKRIKRILPSLLVYVAIMSTLITMFNFSAGVQLKTGLTSIFGVSNIYLYSRYLDYFNFQSELNPFVNTWSLGVEEQFYLIFPFFFLLLNLHRNKKYLGSLFKLIAFLSFLSLLGFQILYFKNIDAAYYLMPFRFWELGIGCLCGIFLFRNKKVILINNKILLVNNIILFSCFFVAYKYGNLSTLLITLCTALFLLDNNYGVANKFLFSNDFCAFLGKLSFSLYLWHWGVLTIGRWTIFNKWSIFVQLLITIIISILNYKFVENYFRFKEWRIQKMGIKLITTSIIFLSSIYQISLSKYFYRNLYLGESFKNEDVKLKNQIFVFGDSIAMDIKSILNRSSNLNILNYTKLGCKFYSIESELEAYKKCSEHYKNIDKIIKLSNKGDTVIIASNYPRKMQIDEKRKINNYEELNYLKKFLDKYINIFERKKVNVLYLLPYPDMEFKDGTKIGPLCRKEIFRPYLIKECYTQAKDVEILNFKSKMEPYYEFLNNYERENQNLYLWDLTKVLCTKKCKAFVDGNQIYHDQIHLAAYNFHVNEVVFNDLILQLDKIK